MSGTTLQVPCSSRDAVGPVRLGACAKQAAAARAHCGVGGRPTASKGVGRMSVHFEPYQFRGIGQNWPRPASVFILSTFSTSTVSWTFPGSS